MECMWKTIYDNAHLFTCDNCPIKKYNCCGTTERDFEELKHCIDLDIQKLKVIREKIIDKME